MKPPPPNPGPLHRRLLPWNSCPLVCAHGFSGPSSPQAWLPVPPTHQGCSEPTALHFHSRLSLQPGLRRWTSSLPRRGLQRSRRNTQSSPQPKATEMDGGEGDGRQAMSCATGPASWGSWLRMRPSWDAHREAEVELAPQGLSSWGVGPDWRSSLRPAWGLCSDQGGSEVAWPCPGSTALPTLAPHPHWLQSAPSTCHALSQGDLRNDEGQGSGAALLWGLPSAEAPELCTVALGLSSRYRSPHTRAPPSLLFPSPDFLPATPPDFLFLPHFQCGGVTSGNGSGCSGRGS